MAYERQWPHWDDRPEHEPPVRKRKTCPACDSYYCDRIYPAVPGLTPPPCRVRIEQRRAS